MPNVHTQKHVGLEGMFIPLTPKDPTMMPKDYLYGIEVGGKEYGLDFAHIPHSALDSLVTGSRIHTEGVLVPAEQVKNKKWNVYKITGVMSVAKFALM